MVGLIKICVNMDEEKSREKQGKMKGRGRGKRKKKWKREMSTDIGSVGGSHKQLKNIEWWQVSDGAKQGGGVLSDEWRKLSEEWWVIKKKSKQELNF